MDARPPLDTASSRVMLQSSDGPQQQRKLLTFPLYRLIPLLLLLHLLLSLPRTPPRTASRLRATTFARHAFLLCGEVRSLREGLSSQLKLLEATEGGIDIFAVLSPTTKHMVRPGVLPDAAADTANVAWLRTLPNLRALRLVDVSHHDSFIKEELGGFPWTDNTFWPYFQPRNVVAAFLKKKLVWELMEDTLRAAGAAAHVYETVVVSRPDIRAHKEQPWWPQGINLNDFSLTGYLRSMPGVEVVPGQPDSWAPSESPARAVRPMPNIFVNSFSSASGPTKVSDMFAIGDFDAVKYYCHAIDFMKRLCSEEKAVFFDPGVLVGAGMISGAREATRRARESDGSAPPHGVRFSEIHVTFCLGKEGGVFSMENNLEGCFDG
jgi:hypothetical protein